MPKRSGHARLLLLLVVVGASLGSTAAFFSNFRAQVAETQCAYDPCKGISNCMAPVMPVACTHTRCNTGACVSAQGTTSFARSSAPVPTPATCGNGVCEQGEKNVCPACSKNVPPCLAPCIAGTCNRDCSTDWEDAICGDGVCVEQERAILCPPCITGVPSPDCQCTLACEKDCRSVFSSMPIGSSAQSAAPVRGIPPSTLSSSSASTAFRSFCGDGRCDTDEADVCYKDCSGLPTAELCGNGQCDPGEWDLVCSIPGPDCIPTMACERDCATRQGDAVSSASQTPSVTFTDLDALSPIGQAAAFLARRGVLSGYPDGSFRPAKLVQRDEIAKMVTTAILNEFPTAPTTPVFRDVPVGSWSWPYIYAAAGYRIVRGHPDGTYRPTDPVNTAEFLKMVSIAFQLPQGLRHDYVDVEPDTWYAPFAGIAQTYGLFPDRSLLLDPSRPMSRGAVAVALAILLQHP